MGRTSPIHRQREPVCVCSVVLLSPSLLFSLSPSVPQRKATTAGRQSFEQRTRAHISTVCERKDNWRLSRERHDERSSFDFVVLGSSSLERWFAWGDFLASAQGALPLTDKRALSVLVFERDGQWADDGSWWIFAGSVLPYPCHLRTLQLLEVTFNPVTTF